MRSIIRYRSGLLSSIFVQVKPSLKKKTFFFLIFMHDEKQKKIFFGETHLNMLKFILKKKKFYFQRFVQVKPSLKKKKFLIRMNKIFVKFKFFFGETHLNMLKLFLRKKKKFCPAVRLLQNVKHV